jgi:hypothetical protein
VEPRLLAQLELEPDHAQVELSDPLGSDYPQWERGDEPAVAAEDCIAVATRPEDEGTVVIEVWEGAPPSHAAELVHEGTFVLAGPEAQIGSYLAGELLGVALGEGRHQVRTYVDQPGYATRIAFVVDSA